MKLETTKRRLALEKKRLRGAISRVVTRVEEGTSRTAVKCVLKELEAQYAEAYRAQVAVEGALPDGDELDAVQERSFYDMH
ncbi:Succinyl-diaminopimelate desuccinylase [Trichinella pseudospiralis]